jgi:alpha-ketoglutarate-dependent taurine dioxygenase
MLAEWKDGDRLSTRCVRPAVIRHPATGESSWFNQAQHWHPACLDRETRRSLFSLFAEDELPRNCLYGDGTRIEDSVMDEICGTYANLEVRFPWREKDILVLDNMLTAHARNPFEGKRVLLVAMGDMKTYDEV